MKSVSNEFYDTVVNLVEMFESNADCTTAEFYAAIKLLRKEIDRKSEAVYRRKMYTLSKTSTDKTVRDIALETYLDEIGLSSDYRY